VIRLARHLIAVLAAVLAFAALVPALARAETRVEAHWQGVSEQLYRGGTTPKRPCGPVCKDLWTKEQAIDPSTPYGQTLLKQLLELRIRLGVHARFETGSCFAFPTDRSWIGWQAGDRYYRLSSIQRMTTHGGELPTTWVRACMRRVPYTIGNGPATLQADGWLAEHTGTGSEYIGFSWDYWFANGCWMTGTAGPPTYSLVGLEDGGLCWVDGEATPTPKFYAWRGEFSSSILAPAEKYVGGSSQPVDLVSYGAPDPGFDRERLLELLDDYPDLRDWLEGTLADLGYAPPDGQGGVGDPVDVVSGSSYEIAQDLAIEGRGLPLQLVRFYNSRSDREVGFGRGWSFSYTASLKAGADGVVSVREPTGSVNRFKDLDGDGRFEAQRGVFDLLRSHEDGSYTLERTNGITWVFSADGVLRSIRDLNGNTLELAYSGGRLVTVRGSTGRELSFTYNATDRVSSVTDWAGRHVDYAYDSGGRLTDVTGHEGATTRYEYDALGQMTKVTQPGSGALPGEVRTYTYDGYGRVTAAHADGGINRLTFDYQPGSYRTVVTDSKDNQSFYYYNQWGDIEKIVDPAGNTLKWGWSERGTNTSVTDQAEQTTTMEYDGHGNVTKIAGPDAGAGRPSTTIEYGWHGRPTKITDPRGGETVMSYDAAWNLQSEQDQNGDETTYGYGPHGELEDVTDADGAVTHYAYDTHGNLATVTDARGKTTTLEHDEVNRLSAQTDPLGARTSYSYDDADRLVGAVMPGSDPVELSWRYDARGDLAEAIDGAGHSTRYEHDQHKRLTATVDATGRRRTFAYDTEGNLVSSVSAAGTTSRFEYDAQRRLVKQISGYGTDQRQTQQFVRSARGGINYAYDAKNRMTRYVYDALGQLTSVIEPGGGTTSYEYNLSGQLAKVADAQGRITRFSYDSAGHLLTKTLDRPDPATDPVWTWTYTPTGQVDTETDPDGRTTDYSHLPTGELAGVDLPGNEPDLSYDYDNAGRLTRATRGTAVNEFSYDALGRVIEERLPGQRTITREYDEAGNQVKLTLPGQDERAFEYDAAGRPTAVVHNQQRTSYDYDTGGRLTLIRFPRTGETTDFDHDPLGRITKVTNTRGPGQLIGWQSYSYDSTNAVTNVATDTGDHSTFEYDSLDRLTQERHTGAGALTRDYAYDKTGNRTSLTQGAVTTPYSYDDLGRLTAAGATHYDYDASGQVVRATTGSDATDYSWDARGRLVGVDAPGTNHDESYAYDALERRITEQRAGQTLTRTFDGREIAQLDSPTGQQRFIRDPGGRLLSLDTDAPADARTYHLDAAGSVTALTDAAGTITDRSSYAAFGAPRTQTGTTPQPFGYLGESASNGTGLHDFDARPYDSTTGRFLSRDPIAGARTQPQGQNPYQYGFNNPLTFEDTDGRYPGPLGPMTGIDSFVDNSIDAASDAASQIVAEPAFQLGELVGIDRTDTANAALAACGWLPFCATRQYYLEAKETKGGVDPLMLAIIGLGDLVPGRAGKPLSQLAKRRLAKSLGRVPRSAVPIAQGGSTTKGRWWEYLDSEGNRKIVVEHPDGTVHVGTPKPQSTHLEGGPPKYYDDGSHGHVGE
jgi:RHS repeat-associated protein